MKNLSMTWITIQSKFKINNNSSINSSNSNSSNLLTSINSNSLKCNSLIMLLATWTSTKAKLRTNQTICLAWVGSRHNNKWICNHHQFTPNNNKHLLAMICSVILVVFSKIKSMLTVNLIIKSRILSSLETTTLTMDITNLMMPSKWEQEDIRLTMEAALTLEIFSETSINLLKAHMITNSSSSIMTFQQISFSSEIKFFLRFKDKLS